MIASFQQSRYACFRVVALAFALFFAANCGDARAQDIFSDFFGGLFGGGHSYQRRPAPAPRPHRQYIPERRMVPSGEPRPHVSRPQKPPRKAPAREVQSERKLPSEASFFVAVLGDTLAQNLADGLEEAFEDAPQIGILHKGKESSGLVRKDYYDWLKAAHDLVSGMQKIDVAVLMIGSNDRQPMSEGGETAEPLSARWRELYAARADAIIRIFKEKNIPLVWVGLPVMRGEKFSADMAQINEIYRAKAADAGISFIDLWDKFADDRGQYSAYGPDINGQPVKLRSDDGVHFTDAGARKLALFLEGEIKRLFDLRQQPKSPETPSPAPTQPAAGAAPPAPAESVTFQSPLGEPPPAAPTLPQDRPAIGQPQPLTGAAPSASDDLARRDRLQTRDSPERAVAQHVFVDGRSQPHRAGRADDLSWPAGKPGDAAPK